MVEKLHIPGKTESFSFIRFAEYRPQTFTADLSIEIPTLAQFIKDETFQPINMVIYLELTSLTISRLDMVCSRIEELLGAVFTVGKEQFRTFPPEQESFSLTLHLLHYVFDNKQIASSTLVRTYDQMQFTLFKGLGRDLKKWVLQEHTTLQQKEDYNPTKWDLEKALSFIKEDSMKNGATKIKNVNLLLLSCWDTENQFEEVVQSIEAFEDTIVPWYYLFTISPVNSMTTALADLLQMPLYNLMIEQTKLTNLQLFWRNVLLQLIEPILEVTYKPTAIGLKHSIATNLTLFQNQKHIDQGFIIYNIQSQRYPIRISFLFKLPVQEGKQSVPVTEQIVLESLDLRLKTSTGEEFKQEQLQKCVTYRLPAGESSYQPERELNTRMRRSEKLKQKLVSIVQQQSELDAQIKKMIIEPNFLQEMVDEETIKDSITNLRLSFEIVNYLQEQELLQTELPPASKMFQPPENGLDLL